MLEAGKSNSISNKILSIQLLLGGLSFYSVSEKKYSYQQLFEGMTPSQAIDTEVLRGGYDTVFIYHNTLQYVMIPEPLFDDNMSEAYLQAKGIVIDEGSQLFKYQHNGIVYLSLLDRGAVPQNSGEVIVLPVIAKCVGAGALSGENALYYIIENNIINITHYEGGVMQFCESLPIVSKSDTIFFINSLVKRYGSGKQFSIVSLFESGDNVISPSHHKKLKIREIEQEQYIEIF